MSFRRPLLALLLSTTLFLAGVHATRAQQEQPAPQVPLLSSDPSGTIDLVGQNRLEIDGFAGTLSVRPGKAGQLRYAARVRDNRRGEQPVGLWSDGQTLRLGPLQAPPEGEAPPEVILEVAIAPGVAVSLAPAAGSTLQLAGVLGDIEVSGERLSVGSRGVQGSHELDLREGTLSIVGAVGAVDLVAENVAIELGDLKGWVTLAVTGGRARVDDVEGPLYGEVAEAELEVESVTGQVDLGASGGRLALHDLRQGARLALRGTPLRMSGARGLVQVDSDAAVLFENLDANLELAVSGASVSGTGLRGVLTLDVADGRVDLDNVTGQARIDGDGLELAVRRVTNNLRIDTASSQVVVEDADGPVNVQNDSGDTRVARATKAVSIRSYGGNVQALELGGPLDLSADGAVAEVSWTKLETDQDSTVENPGGDVHVSFAASVQVKIEAEAENGQISSTLGGVTVTQDGTQAQGMLGKSARSTVKLKAGGDMVLGLAAPPAQPDAPAGEGS